MSVKTAEPVKTKSAVASFFEAGLFLFTGEEMKVSDRPTEASSVVTSENKNQVAQIKHYEQIIQANNSNRSMFENIFRRSQVAEVENTLRSTLSLKATTISRAFAEGKQVKVSIIEFKKRNKTAFMKLDSKPREMDFTVKTEPFDW